VIIKIYFDYIIFPIIYFDICIDIDYIILFINPKFLASIILNVKIVKIPIIQIRKIKTNLYQYFEYTFLNLYLPGNTATTAIQYDTRIVDNLKANILVEMNIIGFENIDVFTLINRMIINSCQNLQISV
jgi:hypothetical protein